jgi:hypothetical protein
MQTLHRVLSGQLGIESGTVRAHFGLMTKLAPYLKLYFTALL